MTRTITSNSLLLTVFAALVTTMTALTPRDAAAAGPAHRFQLKATFLGSFGGETEWQRIDNGTKGRRQDTKNLATVGGAIQAEYPVWRYITVGAATRFYRWNWQVADDANVGASFGMDFNAVVRGRYLLASDRLELSVSMPVGVSVYVPNDDWEAGAFKPETTVGFNVGLSFGVQYFFNDLVGIVADIGWTHRGMGVVRRDNNNKTEFDGDSDQFTMNLGVVFAF